MIHPVPAESGAPPEAAQAPHAHHLVRYDPARGIVIERLVLDSAAIKSEAHHWATGSRGPAVEDLDLAGVDLSALVRQAVDVGVLALRGAGGAHDTHHLDRLVTDVGRQTTAAARHATEGTGRAVTHAQDTLTQAAADAQRAVVAATSEARDALSRQIDTARSSLTAEIDRLVGGEDPLLARRLAASLERVTAGVERQVSARTEEMVNRTARQLDARDPAWPMADLQRRLQEHSRRVTDQMAGSQREIAERMDRLAAAVELASATSTATRAATSVAPIKGADYADHVHATLGPLAAAMGEEYTDVSSNGGQLPRCRKGDGVLSLVSGTGSGTARVVVEMSDSTTRRDWSAYLEQAERNRDAQASLGLVRDPDHLSGERLVTLGPRRMVLAYDPSTDAPDLVRAVLQLLRCQAYLAVTRSGDEHTRTVEEKIAEAITCLGTLTDFRSSAGRIRKDADKVDAGSAALHTTLTRLLSEAAAALAGTETQSTSGTAAA